MYLSRTEHNFLLAAFLITRGDLSIGFTRQKLIQYSALYSWGTPYHNALKKLVESDYLHCAYLPYSNLAYYSITPKCLDYLSSLDHFQQ